MAAPRRVELDEDIGVVVEHELVDVLGNNNLDRLVVGLWRQGVMDAQQAGAGGPGTGSLFTLASTLPSSTS